MQPTLPDGETKPEGSVITRSVGARPISMSDCLGGSDAGVCAATDGLVSDCVTAATAGG
jgi:hypothetical protein